MTLVNEEPQWDINWNNKVTLIANSGIQFLDFSFDFEKAAKFRRKFSEQPIGNDLVTLEAQGQEDQTEDNIINYEITSDKACEVFWDRWIPAPLFLEQSISGSLGPITWARLRVSRQQGSDKIHVIVAVDTSVSDQVLDDEYFQPSPEDAERERRFKIFSDFEVLVEFIQSGIASSQDISTDNIREDTWVGDWVKHIFELALEQKDARGRPKFRWLEENAKLEAFARYIAFIQYLCDNIDFPNLKLQSSAYVSDSVSSIDVDLILDIGNSRTCGLLIETDNATQRANLKQASMLRLRDLSKPELRYEGLFESRVEFCDQHLGYESIARKSGRNNAFLWPSFVRFGPESVRLMSEGPVNQNISGLSSPKRYVWDNELFSQRWRFHNHEDESRLPRSLADVISFMTEEGECIEQVQSDISMRIRQKPSSNLTKAKEAKFSRSSLYGFMVAEIVVQAFHQINDPSYRGEKTNRDIPRRLNRVIVTLPTATPSQEQALVKSRIEGALKLIWGKMIQKKQVAKNSHPKLVVDWDEATCTQVMYLFSEIRRFNNRDNVLELFGRLRKVPKNENFDFKDLDQPSIRIGCVDIGGGTTDVMVTTFYKLHQSQLFPHQDFREGFRVAGDDLLKELISRLILPKLQASVSAQPNPTLEQEFQHLFGRNVALVRVAAQQSKRQFSNRILIELGLKLLQKDIEPGGKWKIDIKDCFEGASEDIEDLLLYIDDPMQSIKPGWRLLDQTLLGTYEELFEVFEDIFGKVFSNLSEVLQKLSVDKLLLTGRTSQHPIVKSLLLRECPTIPNRIVAIHEYEPGDWYPFPTPVKKIGDPKSTVSVGAMLMALSDYSLQEMVLPVDEFTMRSTANFIGKIQRNNKILSDDVIFDLQDEDGDDEYDLEMDAPMFIGSRQLNLERWTASPLYHLSFIKKPKRQSSPYKVTIKKRQSFTQWDEGPVNLVAQATKEQLEIVRVENKEGASVNKSELKLSLQTLGDDGEYWLDNGCYEL